MPRNVGTVLQNKLTRGLITEATGLNFPEDAVTDTDNVVYEKIGRVRRRLGFDVESAAEALAYNDENDGVLQEFVWEAVARTGGFTFLCMQVGVNIHFYEFTVNQSLSAGVVPNSIDMRNYKAPGAPEIKDIPVSFAAGAGFLFIAHPHCNPVVVRYNSTDEIFEVAEINVLIRDIEGVDDGLDTSENPGTLTMEHAYNLRNQGWFKQVRVGSADNEIGTAASAGTPNIPDLGWSPL